MLEEKIVPWLGTTRSYQIFRGKKKVAKSEDLKGLKLRLPEGILLPGDER
jgi:TRAP-type C4-dicarboxylate transport system substrate-binding protein